MHMCSIPIGSRGEPMILIAYGLLPIILYIKGLQQIKGPPGVSVELGRELLEPRGFADHPRRWCCCRLGGAAGGPTARAI